jgi:beta-galactosidase
MLSNFRSRGRHLLYLSGIVDEHNRVIAGGYTGAFREVLGVFVDEFFPLLPGESVELDNGWSAGAWTELLEVPGAEVLASYSMGELSGVPALTRNYLGSGSATYMATRPDDEGLLALVDDVVALAGLRPIAETESGLEVVPRVGASRSYLFAINHSDASRSLHARGTDLLTGTAYEAPITVPARAVMVVQETP